VCGQPVALGGLGQQEERAQTVGELLCRLVAGSVQVSALDAAPMQLRDSVTIVIQPPSSIPRSAASCGSSSQNISGCSSTSYGTVWLIPPAV
jgi:hypothetical protein